jgi:hypothetical protein
MGDTVMVCILKVEIISNALLGRHKLLGIFGSDDFFLRVAPLYQKISSSFRIFSKKMGERHPYGYLKFFYKKLYTTTRFTGLAPLNPKGKCDFLKEQRMSKAIKNLVSALKKCVQWVREEMFEVEEKSVFIPVYLKTEKKGGE